MVHALCLTGGSVYGLEAIGGVTTELLRKVYGAANALAVGRPGTG